MVLVGIACILWVGIDVTKHVLLMLMELLRLVLGNVISDSQPPGSGGLPPGANRNISKMQGTLKRNTESMTTKQYALGPTRFGGSKLSSTTYFCYDFCPRYTMRECPSEMKNPSIPDFRYGFCPMYASRDEVTAVQDNGTNSSLWYFHKVSRHDYTHDSLTKPPPSPPGNDIDAEGTPLRKYVDGNDDALQEHESSVWNFNFR